MHKKPKKFIQNFDHEREGKGPNLRISHRCHMIFTKIANNYSNAVA